MVPWVTYVCVLFLTLHCAQCELLTGDWYWREYNGTVPRDAFPAGADQLSVVYVGQGFIDGKGFYPGAIRENELGIEAATENTAISIKTNIKILCSSSNRLIWINSSTSPPPNSLMVAGGNDFYYFQNISIGGNLHLIRSHYNNRLLVGQSINENTAACFAYEHDQICLSEFDNLYFM